MSDCILWTGAINSEGYGTTTVEGRTRYAHRLAYEAAHGPIAPGLTIDHLCRNRACVNTAHLEAVTNRENILRGNGATARHARKTHCIHGHPLDLVDSRGRLCSTCQRKQRDRWNALRRQRRIDARLAALK